MITALEFNGRLRELPVRYSSILRKHYSIVQDENVIDLE